MIVAHLDLDAFFAAVEELEDPSLRSQPLIVGGDPHGRGVVATANYVARGFGIHSAMSAAEALRRCPHAVFVRPRHSLYREYSRAVWESVRGRRPDGRAHGNRRGLPRPRRGRGRLPARAGARRGGADGGARHDAADVLARRRDVEGRGQGRVGHAASPAGSPSSGRGARQRFSRRSRCASCPGVGPRSAERLAQAGVDTVGALAALTDDGLRSLLPGKVGRLLRDRACGIDPRPLETDVERISISNEETFPRDVDEPARLHDELRRMSDQLAEYLRRERTGARAP